MSAACLALRFCADSERGGAGASAHDVASFPRKGVQKRGERCDERLPLASAHLCNGTLMEHRATDELDAVVAHPEGPAGSLADSSECLG